MENSTKAKPLDAPILPRAKITHGGVNLVQFIVITETGGHYRAVLNPPVKFTCSQIQPGLADFYQIVGTYI